MSSALKSLVASLVNSVSSGQVSGETVLVGLTATYSVGPDGTPIVGQVFVSYNGADAKTLPGGPVMPEGAKPLPNTLSIGEACAIIAAVREARKAPPVAAEPRKVKA